jgi:hypothetical protein
VNAQIIEKDGRPEWAVIPYADYTHLLEVAEDLADIRPGDEALAAIEAGEETLPLVLVWRVCDGESRMRVWRGHPELYVAALASASGPDESMIVSQEGEGAPISPELRDALAGALNINADDLGSWGQE